MAEGSWLPSTWKEARPQIVWGVLILGFGLEFVTRIIAGDYGRALLAGLGLGGLTAMLIHGEQIKQKIFLINPNWIFLSFALFLAALITQPFIEEKKWPLSAWFQASPTAIAPTSSADNEAAIAPVRAERDKAIQERDAARAQLEAVTKERDAQTQIISALQTKLDSLRFPANTDMAPIASIVEPIGWNNRLLFYSGGDRAIKYVVLYGTNKGSNAEQLKSATLSSEITGETRHFSVEVPAHRIDGEQIQLQNIYPVPPGSEIELIMECNPVISVSDFISLLGKAKLEINYGSTTHRSQFNRENIISMISQDIVGADAIVGTPRVTPRVP
jgi:hypothetical protein